MDILALIARGRDDLKVMREVSSSWQEGYEASVTSITIFFEGPGVPQNSWELRERFPSLTSLDPYQARNIELRRFRGMKLQRLVLEGCNDLTVAGLAPLRSLPLTDLSLQVSSGASSETCSWQLFLLFSPVAAFWATGLGWGLLACQQECRLSA